MINFEKINITKNKISLLIIFFKLFLFKIIIIIIFFIYLLIRINFLRFLDFLTNLN